MKSLTKTPAIFGTIARKARAKGAQITRIPNAAPNRQDGWIG